MIQYFAAWYVARRVINALVKLVMNLSIFDFMLIGAFVGMLVVLGNL